MLQNAQAAVEILLGFRDLHQQLVYSLAETPLTIDPRLEVVGIGLWEPYPVVVDSDELTFEVGALDQAVTDFV